MVEVLIKVTAVAVLSAAAYMSVTCPCESLNKCKLKTYYALLATAAVLPWL